MTIIHPEPQSELKNMAIELLALADNPLHVEYVMWPEPGFRVPEYLADRFIAGRELSQPIDPESDTPEPVKRKPGRPKKIVEGQ